MLALRRGIHLASATVCGLFLLSATPTERTLSALPLTVPTYRFGLEQERYASIEESKIERGATLSQWLADFGANDTITANLQATALQLVDAQKLVANRPYTVFTRGGEEVPTYVVYESNDYEQLVFDFDEARTRLRAEAVRTDLVRGRGTIQSNLWNAVTDQGLSPRIAQGVQKALQSAIPLRSLDKGDAFEMVYEKKFVDGEYRGVGKVKMVSLAHRGKTVRAFYFERPNEGIKGYYSEEGENMTSGYLLSPVPGARISSAYNLRRFHPVLKRHKPHYGTDYAAPHGTPIISVANGKVTKVSRTRGNGKFVKIKHDDTYSTQYLHMTRHAKGLRVGQFVEQGQVIGYVGSTGLATGPHTCFRFWKNKKQVNHLNQSLPMGQPLPESLREAFFAERDAMLAMLDGGSL